MEKSGEKIKVFIELAEEKTDFCDFVEDVLDYGENENVKESQKI